jgi:hypothetical protein
MTTTQTTTMQTTTQATTTMTTTTMVTMAATTMTVALDFPAARTLHFSFFIGEECSEVCFVCFHVTLPITLLVRKSRSLPLDAQLNKRRGGGGKEIHKNQE